MKLLARIVRPFYSVEHKTSQQQLLDDFGEFPPTPLSCESLKGEFEIVRIDGVVEIYQKVMTLQKLVKTMIKSNDSGMSADMSISYRDSSEGQKLYESTRKLNAALNDFPSVFKPLLKALFFSFMYIFFTVFSIRLFNSQKHTYLGAFDNLFENDSQIKIQMQGLRKQQMCYVSVISHEHIHLLQHKKNQIHSYVKSPQDFLKNSLLLNDNGYKEIMYLLHNKEVEARLHEIVLSFYRIYRNLPLTTSDFLRLISSSLEFPLDYIDETFVEFEKYPVREPMFADNLRYCLYGIRTKELQYRFVTEVLTVMYGNLLNYYGDPVASENYLKEILRPNLYDELYLA